MNYINAISSISHQASFDNPGFSSAILPITPESSPIHPDYKLYIDPSLLRRMTEILRMSVACSRYCLNKIGSAEIEAIIIGTGLGCLTDTKKFLENFISIDGLLPPTSFIQSTHNTIAGQISLSLKNNGYNTTYSQNTISFELGLQDAILQLNEGTKNALVGAADEHIPMLGEIAKAMNWNPGILSSGVTCMVLSNCKTSNTLAEISAVKIIYKATSILDEIHDFLSKNKVELHSLDRVYFSSPFNNPTQSFTLDGIQLTDMSTLTGTYPTNSALAVHLAADEISIGNAKRVLVCNNLNAEHLGLTLIQKTT